MWSTADFAIRTKALTWSKGSGNDEQALKCRWDLANHSPDGPEWGYGGSGPSQLALSLVADALESNRAGDQLALGFYQDFK
jgi:Family of unknown function (DUF6166)